MKYKLEKNKLNETDRTKAAPGNSEAAFCLAAELITTREGIV